MSNEYMVKIVEGSQVAPPQTAASTVENGVTATGGSSRSMRYNPDNPFKNEVMHLIADKLMTAKKIPPALEKERLEAFAHAYDCLWDKYYDEWKTEKTRNSFMSFFSYIFDNKITESFMDELLNFIQEEIGHKAFDQIIRSQKDNGAYDEAFNLHKREIEEKHTRKLGSVNAKRELAPASTAESEMSENSTLYVVHNNRVEPNQTTTDPYILSYGKALNELLGTLAEECDFTLHPLFQIQVTTTPQEISAASLYAGMPVMGPGDKVSKASTDGLAFDLFSNLLYWHTPFYFTLEEPCKDKLRFSKEYSILANHLYYDSYRPGRFNISLPQEIEFIKNGFLPPYFEFLSGESNSQGQFTNFRREMDINENITADGFTATAARFTNGLNQCLEAFYDACNGAKIPSNVTLNQYPMKINGHSYVVSGPFNADVSPPISGQNGYTPDHYYRTPSNNEKTMWEHVKFACRAEVRTHMYFSNPECQENWSFMMAGYTDHKPLPYPGSSDCDIECLVKFIKEKIPLKNLFELLYGPPPSPPTTQPASTQPTTKQPTTQAPTDVAEKPTEVTEKPKNSSKIEVATVSLLGISVGLLSCTVLILLLRRGIENSRISNMQTGEATGTSDTLPTESPTTGTASAALRKSQELDVISVT